MPEQERTTEAKNRFVEEYEKSYGIIVTACARANIDRRTYYRWMEEDEEFKKKIKSLEKVQVGYVHDKLMSGIVDSNMTAIIFYLKNKHPDYKQKLELSGEVTTKEKYKGLTDEEILDRIEETKKIKEALVSHESSEQGETNTEG